MAKVRSIKKKSKKTKDIRKKLVIALAGFILLSLWMSPATLKLVEAKKANDKLHKELKQAKKNNSKLKKRIGKLHSDDYIELEARKQLGYIKPGQKAYLVIPKKTVEKKRKVKEKSWLENTLDYLKEKF